VYGLFVVPIVTGFFSVLGMAIERFQVREKNNDDIQNHPLHTSYFASWSIDARTTIPEDTIYTNQRKNNDF
jgi:hypothetical protein